MPTYDYACENCGHKWDVEQRMSEDPIRKCPKCGKLKAKRQITGGNFILKGGGWYSDLYSSAKPSKKASSESETSSSSSETTSESTKAETPKVETKAETKSESKPSKKAASKD